MPDYEEWPGANHGPVFPAPRGAKGGPKKLLARLTRHQLKKDELGVNLALGMDYFLKHKKQISIIASIAVGALGLGLGIYFYIRGAQDNASAAFAKALDTYHAPVMPSPPPNAPNLEVYKTNDARNQKALEEFTAVAHDYSHYAAGRMARYYAALCLRDLGKYPEAEKEFQAVSNLSDKQLASLAKMGLASVYELTGRASEAEKLYKELEENPTETVPKATALIARADLLRQSNPAESARLYQQIQKEYAGTAAADRAGAMLSELPH